MNVYARCLAFLAALLMLSGCGSSGSSANPPSGGLTVVPGDTQVTLTWAMEPNVEYWAFFVAGPAISSDNPTSTANHVNRINVTSPLVINGLVNGTTYAFTVNGRTHGGPGGTGTPSVTATPRLAGGSWKLGTALGGSDLNGVTYGTVGGNIFLAVGAGGQTVTSADGITWVTQTNAASAADLNTVVFGGASYVAAGAGGVILYSADGLTWAAQASGTTNPIYSMTSNGASTCVGVGAQGTIVYGNGTTWTVATAQTTNDLLAVAYGNGTFVAVGAAGTLLTSTDAVNWTAVSSSTAARLKAVAYGLNATTGTILFVAGGANGALITSPDAVTWTSSTSLPVASINSVIYGSQFVLAGDAGIIYTSTDGASWQAQSSGTTSNLKAAARNLATLGYSAVGASGTNLTAY